LHFLLTPLEAAKHLLNRKMQSIKSGSWGIALLRFTL